LAADTEEQAWHLFKSRARWRMDRNLGRIGPVLPPDQAERDYSPAEQLDLAQLKANALVGSGPQVANKLRALAQRMDIDEIVVITWTHDPVHQRRSYELLAKEFAWGQRAPSPELETALI
jgi:alkanesulfonate monooxygenase SsuD/methylene tetrahydromethanopterin reductase-like flavin-dependent oxidoreductase (luciferase family)